MARYIVKFTAKADKDLYEWKKIGDRSIIKKIEKIFDELLEHPNIGTGQVERLKGDLSGYWSRRLNKKDRMIYTIDDVEAIVYVLSLKGHYE